MRRPRVEIRRDDVLVLGGRVRREHLPPPGPAMNRGDGDDADGDVMGAIRRLVKRAVTDSETEVRFDVDAKPGVSNLLSILGAATDRSPEEVAAELPNLL